MTRTTGSSARPRFLLPWALVLSLLGVNCAEDPSTQLVVLMDTDYSVPTEVDRVRARIAKVVDTEGGPQEVPSQLTRTARPSTA